MTKPTNWLCAQRRLRSAWASAQADQSLDCPHEESLGPKLPTERTVKTLIRLGGCPGWSVFVVRMKKAWVLSYLLSTSEDSDQTGRMPRLIWFFAGHTGNFVVFVMRRLIRHALVYYYTSCNEWRFHKIKLKNDMTVLPAIEQKIHLPFNFFTKWFITTWYSI